MNVSLWLWLAVIAVIAAMLAIDLFAHRRAHAIGVREAAAWSALWVGCGVGFDAFVWQVYGAEWGRQHFAGYLIEKSLAVDNVFVWAIIFSGAVANSGREAGTVQFFTLSGLLRASDVRSSRRLG